MIILKNNYNYHLTKCLSAWAHKNKINIMSIIPRLTRNPTEWQPQRKGEGGRKNWKDTETRARVNFKTSDKIRNWRESIYEHWNVFSDSKLKENKVRQVKSLKPLQWRPFIWRQMVLFSSIPSNPCLENSILSKLFQSSRVLYPLMSDWRQIDYIFYLTSMTVPP